LRLVIATMTIEEINSDINSRKYFKKCWFWIKENWIKINQR
jgi:hypothetical protein